MQFRATFTNGDSAIECIAGRSSIWKALDYIDTLPETGSKPAISDFAVGYFVARDSGKLDALKVPQDIQKKPLEAIYFLGDHYDLTADPVDIPAPLA